MSITKKWNQRTSGHLISDSNDSEFDNPPPDSPPSLCTSISHQYCHFMANLRSHQPWPCTVISRQPCPCKLALYWVCHVSHFLNSKARIQPRDRAGLLSKQSAHTDPNLIPGLEPQPFCMKHWCFIDWAIWSAKYVRDTVVSASDSWSGGCGFDPNHSSCCNCLGKAIYLYFLSTPACKMGTRP